MSKPQLDELRDLAARYRRRLLEVTVETGGSYLAQALSATELLVALFHGHIRCRPEEPDWPGRDRFLLSPGHYALALYVVLADLGFFPEESLRTFKENGSPFEMAAHRGTVPGVEVSGGSLGQVLSVGVGMALHAKLRRQWHRVVVFMSDGEQDEGQIWEAAASAAHFGLGNLTAVVDKNGFQVDGATTEVMDMEPLAEKYRAFGWQVMEVDGNDLEQVVDALDLLSRPRSVPGIVVGNTVRGKGIGFMEGDPGFHYTRLDQTGAAAAVEDLRADWDAA